MPLQNSTPITRIRPVFLQTEFSERSDIFLYLVIFQAQLTTMIHNFAGKIPLGKFRLVEENLKSVHNAACREVVAICYNY
jgi:hypothetical protein